MKNPAFSRTYCCSGAVRTAGTDGGSSMVRPPESHNQFARQSRTEATSGSRGSETYSAKTGIL